MENDDVPEAESRPKGLKETSGRSEKSEADNGAPANREGGLSVPSDPAKKDVATLTSPKAGPKPLLSSLARRLHDTFAEQQPKVFAVPERDLRGRTRRDFIIYGLGTLTAAAAAGFLLPSDTLRRFGFRFSGNPSLKENFLNQVLAFDDEVAKYLYSPSRLVPIYSRSQITDLRNNYNGATPDPGYISDWKLTLKGLAAGSTVTLTIQDLRDRFVVHEQITRLVCVEGWSGIGWWTGIRFDDLLRAYPPIAGAKWARLDSSVNLDSMGNPDPYYVSIDLPTARHPQTLLATHQNRQPLTVEHGAPLRLLAPMKIGLKNIKAITQITYSVEEPADYWAIRGYSKYEGI
jgi:hypothetical protein